MCWLTTRASNSSKFQSPQLIKPVSKKSNNILYIKQARYQRQTKDSCCLYNGGIEYEFVT